MEHPYQSLDLSKLARCQRLVFDADTSFFADVFADYPGDDNETVYTFRLAADNEIAIRRIWAW